MPKSKTDKKRKAKLIDFKNKKKKQMQEQELQQELSKIPQIQQYPVWSPNEKIELSGVEWESIYNVLNMFKQGILAGESVMQRNIQTGKIKLRYVDQQGQEVTKEQVEEYTKQIQTLLQKRSELQNKTVSPILSETGEQIVTESVPEIEELPTTNGNVTALHAV